MLAQRVVARAIVGRNFATYHDIATRDIATRDIPTRDISTRHDIATLVLGRAQPAGPRQHPDAGPDDLTTGDYRGTETDPKPTPVSARARGAGLIDIRSVVPDAIVDLRYRTSNNFTKVRLYPLDARCLVHRSMAPGLLTAARELRRAGDLLVFWDCYRPHAVQVRMFRIVPDPDWVARPGPYATSHEAGRSVDVTLARAEPESRCTARWRVQGRCLLAMGTGYDDFTQRAYAYTTAGVSTAAQANRGRLRTAMAAGGISVYRGEWWHFDGPGALAPRPHLHAPLS